MLMRIEVKNHMKENQNNCKEFKCDKCEKTFVTKWRLQKHRTMHSNKNTKQCRYFTDDVECPFKSLGCKLLHVISKESFEESFD